VIAGKVLLHDRDFSVSLSEPTERATHHTQVTVKRGFHCNSRLFSLFHAFLTPARHAILHERHAFFIVAFLRYCAFHFIFARYFFLATPRRQPLRRFHAAAPFFRRLSSFSCNGSFTPLFSLATLRHQEALFFWPSHTARVSITHNGHRHEYAAASRYGRTVQPNTASRHNIA